ncbi:MAG TPA: ATP-binding protein [Bryobacteraceae bacterium]|nr:ATP-binding protein [Bryobacteraceae bacterium]
MDGSAEREFAEFLLRACHDFRAAARAVRLHSELLRKDPAPAEADTAERLGFVIESAARIDALIDGLAAYSTALLTEAGGFQPVNLAMTLRLALAKLDKLLGEAGAEVRYGELPWVTGNPDRLAQVFENLLRNAAENRSPAPLRIEVGATLSGGEWVITVEDNGAGIDPGLLENVFRPFERMRGGSRAGAGLGLASCRIIVLRHGGRMWAESAPGRGSRFSFTLPREGNEGKAGSG